MIREAACLLAFCICWGVGAAAEQGPPVADSPPGFDLAAASQWPLERLELKDGRVFQGMVLSPRRTDKPGDVPFEIVQRPRGRPMYLVVQKFPQQSIAKIDRLSPDERAKLAERIERFKGRAVEEVFEMGKLDLKTGEAGGPQWIYDSGPWFRLESWTDEEMTRRTIVRIEQIFLAYGQILRARAKPQQPLRIFLYGSMRDYGEFQTRHTIRIENPAVYLPNLNLLAAGSELSAFAKRLADVREQHAAIRARYEQMEAAMPKELKKLSDDLEKSGVPAAERRATILAAQRKWKQELGEADRKMQAIDRSNGAQFELVTKEMLTRLYHEAFHAYLESFVYPQAQCDVPRWLNEGLAQVFEEGLLELGTLRLDAPSSKRLSALQADLVVEPRLSLTELLTADSRAFLVAHPTNVKTSQRYYLYSWALAYYLAVREPVLEMARLDRYVDRQNAQDNPIARFEQLVGMPLDQFEQRWREDMLAMKGPEK